MTWQDRLREAAYTPPSGSPRITFTYENVQKQTEKKTTAFEFPDVNGTFVQDLGHTGRRVPLRVIFWGDDHDLEAATFEAALLEKGAGLLEHPAYGSIDVVPFGAITLRNDLKTAGNQTIVEVSFFETTGLAYPLNQNDPASQVLAAIDEYNSAAAAQFADGVELETTVERGSFENQWQSLIDAARDGLKPIADTQQDVANQFDAIYQSINQSIDVLVRDPLTLAFQTGILLQAPARALTSIEARLDAYNNLASSVIGTGIATQGYDSENENNFKAGDFYASTYVSGSVLAVVNNQFQTKSEALTAAEGIINQLTQVVEWRDNNYESLDEIDTGELYQKLQEAVAIATGFLVEISFTLKQEKRFTLDRNRSVIDLVAELYGEVDDQLDLFISSNNLSGSEILELPAGREIVYYI